MIKGRLQRWVCATRDRPGLRHGYEVCYRAAEPLARRLLPPDVREVFAIRGPASPGFLLGVSDVDLLAVVDSQAGDRHVETVRALARANGWLRRLLPYFGYCLSVTERERSLPAADLWLACRDPRVRRPGPRDAAEVVWARVLALQNACRWFLRANSMPNLFRGPGVGALPNEERRAWRILRELAYGLGVVGEGVYDEGAFGRWRTAVARQNGWPELAATELAACWRWYGTGPGVHAVWQYFDDAARHFDGEGVRERSGAGVGGSGGSTPRDLEREHQRAGLTQHLARFGVEVCPGEAGNRAPDPEWYLVLPEDEEPGPEQFQAIAEAWRAVRSQGSPDAGLVGAPMIFSSPLLRWVLAICPWRRTWLHQAGFRWGERWIPGEPPWEVHARLAQHFSTCRDFREDVQGGVEEIVSLARFALPQLLLCISEGIQRATPEGVEAEFGRRFGVGAWGWDALCREGERCLRAGAGLERRVDYFRAGLPLANEALDQLQRVVGRLPVPEGPPRLRELTPRWRVLQAAAANL